MERCSALWDILFILLLGDVYGASEEWALLDKLLSGYDTAVRPVTKTSDTLNFTMELSLNQITDMDERNQIIRLLVWMRWQWADSYLQWNHSEHGGTEEVYIQPTRIWIPDITLYNSGSREFSGWPSHYNARVRHDGSVTYLFPAFIEVSCEVDVINFPFDNARCPIKFGSWVYSGALLDIYSSTPYGKNNSLLQNKEWEMLEFPRKRIVTFYPANPHPYPQLEFVLVLKRRPLHYVYNLLMPSIVITWLGSLSFPLPVESGEKMSLNITVLLTLVVFSLNVTNLLPVQSEAITLTGLFFGVCIVLLSLAMLASALVTHLHFRGSRGQEIPRWLRTVMRGLGYITCYNQSVSTVGFASKILFTVFLKNLIPPEFFQLYSGRRFILIAGYDRGNTSEQLSRQPKDKDIKTGEGEKKETRLPETEMTYGIGQGQITPEKEWVIVSLILDRLFFILFCIGASVATIYVLSFS